MSGFDGGAFIFGGHLPEDLQAEMDKYKMKLEDATNQINSFMSHLPVEDMKTLGMMLDSITENLNLTHFWMGKLAVWIQLKEGDKLDICETCLTIHSDGLDSGHENMVLFRVKALDNGQIECKDCGQVYPNLKDRMLKKPDECKGCVQQAKWGGRAG